MSTASEAGAAAPSSRQVVPKAEQARRTRTLIIETGIRCLAEHGFANTTMLLIAREAGISRGPLHYHFEDRNALMAAIAKALPRGVSAALIRRLLAPRSIEARLETMIEVALEEHLGAHHFAAMELLLAARNDPGLSDAIRPYFLASEMEIDAWWSDYFAMLQWPTTRLTAFRHVVVACLRGLALDHILQGDAQAHQDALVLFREMFLSFGQRDSSNA